MFILRRASVFALIVIFYRGWLPTAGAAEVLDLASAERLAIEQDRNSAALRAEAAALENRAVADGQLPDPRLKLGAMNLPTDTFDRAQEAMTQMQVGVQQAFPPGRTLDEKQQRSAALARASQTQAEAQILAVIRDTRLAFLELHYQLHAEQVVDESRRLFEQLVKVTESHYAAGRKNQQDVLRAGVELALLDDRATRIQTAQDKARATLAKLVGERAATRPLADVFPSLPGLPAYAELEQAIKNHPLIEADNQRVAAGQSAVEIARQRYKPGWMLDLTYGDRTGNNPNGSTRSDFLSAMVSLDIPLFTKNRQDKVLAAEQKKLSAVQLKREDRYLELKRKLEADYAEWRQLAERVQLYRDSVVPQAEQNAESSLSAYQSGVSDFTGLMRARLTELDSRLTALRLETDHASAQARLLYLAGEQP